MSYLQAPGPRRRPLHALQAAYEQEGLQNGLTVAEWEALHALPFFSVYPSARRAVKEALFAYHMYDRKSPDFMEVQDEESRQMRCLRALGMQYREIAALFGMSLKHAWDRIQES